MYYKFKIKELIAQLPSGDAKKAMKNLPGLLRINRTQFSKLINTPASSGYKPTPEVLIQLASFFQVSVDALYNNPPRPITIEDVYSAEENQIKNNL
jgi:hypothetical protein